MILDQTPIAIEHALKTIRIQTIVKNGGKHING